MKSRLNTFFRTLLIICVLCLPVVSACGAESLPEMQFHQVALVSANCHLLIAGDTVILIDGGTDTDAHLTPEIMMDYVAATGIDHIDAHFVTHYHNDHAQQLDDFSRLYGTDSTVVYGPSPSLPSRFLPLPNGSYEQITAGQEVDVGPFHVKCVGPEPSPSITGEVNRNSLNLIITYGRLRILVTGDYVTGYVLDTFPADIADVDILIFPHHGIEPFVIGPRTLRLVNPDLVLIPGRSSAAVLELLAKNNLSPEVRSPAYGNIVITSDGNTWELHDDVQPGEYVYGAE